MTALKALVVLLIVSAVFAADVDVDAERPPRKGKKLVAPRVIAPRPMMDKKHIVIVPKGDPRARPPSSFDAAAAAARPVLRAGATTSSACAARKGKCVPRASCGGSSTVVSGLCPGVTYCCVPKAAAPAQPAKPAQPAQPAKPSAPIDTGSCPVYGGLATTPKAGNGNVMYSTVPIQTQHLVDPSAFGKDDSLADNTMRLQPTACAFARMAEAAAKDGVFLKIASGFRTLKRQNYFWHCYQCKCCNGGNLAAHPGTSNHGQGIALDLNVDCGKQSGSRAPSLCKSSRVYMWLLNNAQRFGFIRAVQIEPWHWEYHPGSPMPSWARF